MFQIKWIGPYYPMEYMCRTFGIVEGNEWFGRNKQADLTKPFELKTKKLPIDYNVNEYKHLIC